MSIILEAFLSYTNVHLCITIFCFVALHSACCYTQRQRKISKKKRQFATIKTNTILENNIDNVTIHYLLLFDTMFDCLFVILSDRRSQSEDRRPESLILEVIIIISWPLIVVRVMDGDWKRKKKNKKKETNLETVIGFRSRVFLVVVCFD